MFTEYQHTNNFLYVHLILCVFFHFKRQLCSQKLTYSPACWIQNLPWKIFIEPVVQSGKKYLSVYVGCTQSGIEHWTCRAVVEIYKLFGLTPKIIRASTGLIFDSAASTSWGHIQFIQWDVVANPVNGFMKDGAITIEVTITADIPVGLTLAPDHFTDERANILYRQWISEKIILEEEIQNLNKLNEEKEDEVISNQQLIDNLKTELLKSRDLNNQLNEYKKNFETEHSTLVQLQLKNKVCEDNLKKEKDNSEKLKQEISDLNAEIKDLKEKIESSSKQLQDYKKVIQSSNTNNLCDQTLKLTESENVDLKKQLALLEAKLKDLNNKSKKQTEDYENQIKNIEIDKDTLKNNLETISKDCNLAKEQLNSMETSSSKEKAAMKKTEEEMKKTIEELKEQMKNLNVTNQDLNTRKDKLGAQVATLQLQLKKTSETENQVQEKQKSIEVERDTLKNSLETISKDCSSAKEELESLRKTYSEVQIAMKKKEEEMNETIQDLKDEMKTLGVANRDMTAEKDELENQIAALQSELKKSSETEEMLGEKLKTIEEERNTLKNNLGTISKDCSSGKQELESLKKTYSDVQIAMKKNEKELNETIKDLNDKMNSLGVANQDLKAEKDKLEDQIATLQSQLKTSAETVEVLQGKLKTIEVERNTLKTNVENISKDCSSTKEELNSLKKTNSEVQVALKKNGDELNETIQDLRNKMKTLDLSKQNLITEKDNLENQVATLQLQLKKASEAEQMIQEKQKSVDLERDTLKKGLETMTKHCNLVKEELNSLKTTYSELQVSMKKNENDLNKAVQDSKNQIADLNVRNQELNTEKGKLEQQIAGLQLQLKKNYEREEIVRENQNTINNLKTENQNLVAQMKVGYEQFNKLKKIKENSDSQLKIVMENYSKVNEEATRLKQNIASTHKDLSDSKQKLEQLQSENDDLNAKIRSSTTQLEEIKKKLIPSRDDSNDVTDLKNYSEKLKSEITSLMGSLSDSINDIQRMKNKYKKRTTGEEPPNFQIDLNNQNVTRDEDLKNFTSINRIKEVEGKYKIAIDAKNKLRCEMEALKKKFEKINKDAQETSAERYRNATRDLSNLQYKLEEERIEKMLILDRKRDVDDELKELKQENEAQIKTKYNLLYQLRECHKLSKEIFWIIIELVKIKKSQDAMPCSIEARLMDIMELLSANKRRVFCRLTIRDSELNQPASIKISTDVIQKKLEDLEGRLEKEIEIVFCELKAEKTRRMKLVLTNEKLIQLLENEMLVKDQYKKFTRVNELRSQEIENRMNGSFGQFFSTKFQYEDDFHQLSRKIASIEQQTDFLKKHMWRQSVELNECSCTSNEDISFNNIQRSIQISSDFDDVRTGIAGCESQTSTDEHPVYTPPTQCTTEPNNVAVKQDEQKNAEVVGNIEGARIIESNPNSASNSN